MLMLMGDGARKIYRATRMAVHRFDVGWFAPRKLWCEVRKIDVRKPLHAIFVGALVAGIVAPVLNAWAVNAQYHLSTADKNVISTVAPSLLSKLSHDDAKQASVFNPGGATVANANPVDKLAASAGAGGKKDQQLYTATMPDDPSKGVTVNDNVNQVDVTFTPQFSLLDGKKGTGHVSYPLSNQAGQLIFTPKANGVKEDILLNQAPKSDTSSYSYKLTIPSYLQARLNEDGSIGMYSGDPQLFGNITYGSDVDRASVNKAREASAKTYQMFQIPAPKVKQSGDGKHLVTSVFTLSNNILTVHVRGLSQASYPLSIDPTFVITSTSDFVLGSVDDNIDLTVAGQIGRATLSGGSVSGWTVDTNSLANGDYAAGLVAYNSALYLIGGGNQDGTTNNTSTTRVQYVLLNSNGTENGTWTNTSALNIARQGLVAFGFNGYLYAIGGDNTSGVALSSVEYAKINSDGSVGAWTTSTNSLRSARGYPAGGIYQGVLYVVGGASGTMNAGLLATSEYSRINGDGSVGTWTVSTSTANGSLAIATNRFQGGAYNGFLYAVGGLTAAPAVINTVQYAPINADGSLGTWITSTGFPTARRDHGVGVVNGHVYVYAGCSTATLPCPTANLLPDTEYAVINADGSVGDWQQTQDYNFNSGTAPYGPRVDSSSAFYNGYLHFVGGCNAEASATTVHCTSAGLRVGTFYTGFDVPGRFDQGDQTSQTNQPYNNTTPSSARAGVQSVALNGFIYYISGCSTANCTTYDNTVEYAPINANGSLGTFITTTSLPGASGNMPGRMGHSLAAYNNQLYVIGGAEHAQGSFPTTAAPTTTAFATAATAHAVTMPGTVTAGDLLLVTLTTGSGSATVTLPAGWTLVAKQSRGGNAPLASVYAKVAAGNEGGTTVGFTTSATATAAANVYRVLANAWWGTISTGIAAQAFDPGLSTASLNPGALTPSWGADNTLWVAFGAGSTYTGVTSYPTGFTGGVNTVASSGAAGASAATATIAANTATEDPSPFTMSSSNNGVAYTIGIRPAPGAVTYTPSIMTSTVSNTGTLGAWSTQTALGGNDLPAARAFATTQLWHNYIYVMGGRDASNTYGTIYRSQIDATGLLGTWSPTTTGLAHVRWGASGGIWGNYLYVVGGNSDTGGTYVTAANGVEQLTVLASGDITAPSSTQNPSGQILNRLAGGFVHNGYLYTFGGYTSGSTAAVTTIQWSKLSPTNGSLGAWSKVNIGNAITCTTTTCPATGTYGLATAVGLTTAVEYDGSAFILGGCVATLATNSFDACSTTTTLANSVQAYIINNGGTGQLSTWSSPNSMNTIRADFGSIANNGFIYAVGGCSAYSGGACSAILSSVESAAINPDGSLGTWTAQTSLPSARSWFQSVVFNNFIYVLSGRDASNTANPQVIYAPISATGAIGAWVDSSLNYLPSGAERYGFGAAVSNGYIYVGGGSNASSRVNTVYYSKTNTDGSLATDSGCGSTWCAGTSFVTPRLTPNMVAYNGVLYMISGINASGVTLTDVQYAALGANGSVGAWNYATDIARGLSYRQVVAANGYMYFLGDDGAQQESSYAAINADGTLGSIQNVVNDMPGPHSRASAVFYNGSFYNLGGCSSYTGVNCNPKANVDRAGQQAVSRIGHYSKLFNTQVDTSPTQLVVNGATSGPGSAVEFRFQTASTSDPVLGVAQVFKPITFGRFYNVQALNSSGVNVGVAYNYQYIITLDDSRSATFPDVANTGSGYAQTSVTDATLYYHANPARRLRHGASFTNTSCNGDDPSSGCLLDTAP